jgi:hypothetical protein
MKTATRLVNKARPSQRRIQPAAFALLALEDAFEGTLLAKPSQDPIRLQGRRDFDEAIAVGTRSFGGHDKTFGREQVNNRWARQAAPTMRRLKTNDDCCP